MSVETSQPNIGTRSLTSWLNVTLVTAICLPPLFLFWAIQYSALVYPYMDHIATAVFLIAYYDGTLRFADLFGNLVEARPLIPRLFMLFNAILTDWDIRSEFAIVYVSIVGVLAAHLVTLWHLSRNLPALPFLVASLLISIIVCSPAGAHTQYFSLMLLLTLCWLFATISLLVVSCRQNSWSGNVIAAVMGWLAAYSVTNGLFLFPAIFLTHQLASGKIFKLNRWGLFWLVNTVVLYLVYLWTLPRGGTPPLWSDWAIFALIYLGNPLRSLVWFPLLAQTDPSATNLVPAYYGAALLGVALFTARRALADLRAQRPEAFIFFAFAGFAVISALVTGWGRAIGEYTVALASGSRYTVFGNSLLIGLIYYYATRVARAGYGAQNLWPGGCGRAASDDVAVRGVSIRGYIHRYGFAVGLGVICVFVALSTRTYIRAVPLYLHTHDMNIALSNAYGRRANPSDADVMIFPSLEFFRDIKASLYRLGIGPYRLQPVEIVALTAGPFSSNLALTAGKKVVQRFVPARPILMFASLPIGEPQGRATPYSIDWKLVSITKGVRAEIGKGQIATSRLRGAKPVPIPAYITPFAADEVELELSVASDQDTKVPAAIPLLQALPEEHRIPVEIDGSPSAEGIVVGIQAQYER